MRSVLDLHALVSQLRQAKEHEPQFDEELNAYLLYTVVPMLEQGEVTLDQIDLNEFDEEDPFTILRYFDWKGELSRDMYRINDRLCQIPPACIKARAFL